MTGEPLALEVDGEIARVGIGRAGGRAPVLGAALLAELDRLLEELEALAAAGAVSVVLLEGRGSDGFVVGSALEDFQRVGSAQEGTELALAGQRVLRRLERLPIPSLAAIEGACLGGGLELALACSHRIAADSPRTRLGVPEVRIGLIPGYGGTVRLPRLVGAQAALALLLTGRPADAAEALRTGLVDEVAPPRKLADRAQRLAASLAEGGRPRSRAGRRLQRRMLEDTAPGRRLVFRRAARRFLPAGDGSPAPRLALEAVAEGLALPLERAFVREARVFGELLTTPTTRSLLHAQVLWQEATRGPLEPERTVERAAVLGAGATGSAIAYLLGRAGVEVRVKDRKRTAMAAGVEAARALLEREAGRGGAARAAVEPATGFGGFGTLDLVVAAVGGTPEAARRALREAVEHTRDEALLALAAPVVSLPEAGETIAPPSRLFGLHVAEPIEDFALLEILAGDAAPRVAMDRMVEVARRMGRVPVRVADRPGGLLPRLAGAYFAEALRLLDEGAGVLPVDAAMERFGFRMGPFRRMDAVGVDRAVRGLRQLAEIVGERMAPATVAERLAAEGGTFYRYRKGRAVGPAPGLPAAAAARPEEHEALIRERLLLLLVNEAALAEGEGVAEAGAIDLASIAGVGFPRGRGGVLHHARQGDPAALLERFARLEERFGARFAPAPVLGRAAGTPPAGHAPAGML